MSGPGTRVPLPATWLAALALLTTVSAARSATLPDSTVRDAWRLENGLEIRTVHVAEAAGIALTVAYRAGSGYEPPELEGLAELLAEVHAMSAVGEIPERTRDDMASLRPLGWESSTNARLARITEIVTAQQLPGVLQEAARRMAGVTLTDAGVRAALAGLRRELGRRYFGPTAEMMYWRASALARGFDDEHLVRYAGLRALDRIGSRELAPWLKRWYHAGNASLAICGNLDGIDVRALIRSLFEPLPGGAAMPDTVQVRLQGVKRVVPWRGLEAPVGAIAVTSPALTDSLHPAFYLGMLVTGPAVTRAWGPATPPLTTRFQYSLFDEPELVRFYPPVRADATDPDLVAGALYEMLMVVGGQNVMANILVRLKHSVGWLLGGELPSELRARMRTDASGLGTLSSGVAARALWMGDTFWSDYAARFERLLIGHNFFYERITKPEHQAVLLLTPAR